MSNLSDFIERHKGLYYESVTLVRTQNNLAGWLKFFLTAVIETAKNGVETFKKFLALKHDMDAMVLEFGKRSPNAKALLDYLYKKPVISVADIIEPLKITKPTANTLVKEFVSRQVLVEETGFQRNQIFIFKRYLDIYSKN
jgi:Fic family protein